MIEPTLRHQGSIRPPIAMLGVTFDNVTLGEAVQMVEGMVVSGRPHYLVTPNVDFLVQARRDVELRRILMDADLVLCDGMPLVWASRLLGNPLPERVAGADLVPLLIRLAAEKNYRVFFLGGTVKSMAQAVARLQAEYPTLQVAGYSPPFDRLLAMDHEDIKSRIQEFQPHFLFVSFGCPKQEKWVAMHHQSLGVPVCAGVGGTIDFLAGQLKRAPLWMQRIGTEWLFRLAQEPRRLLRRYVEDFAIFGRAMFVQWWHLRARPKRTARTSHSLAELKLWTSINPGERLDLAIACDIELSPERLIRDKRPCVVALSEVRFIDSAGAAWLMRLNRAFRAVERELILLAPSRATIRALRLLRLEHFFAVAPDVTAAWELIEARSHEQPAVVEANFEMPALLAWQGEITAANAESVWRLTEAQIAEAPASSQMVIDLSRVRFIDSSGLSLMGRARNLARTYGLQVDFTGAQPSVRDVLKLAGMANLVWE
jgi:N-acetylglucosaminyldiphosphoundecaprenol N-acetyl-beta-D-mannosaminyltransferase